jgi:nitric oxide dioxygenase
MALSPEQSTIIKATVPILQEHGEAITRLFYRNMLDAHPELNSIFNQANQFTNKQPAALAASLYAYASNIENVSSLLPALEKICQKHVSMYIQPEQYEIVGKYLIEAMGQVLGDALTPEIKDTWIKAYNQLADVVSTSFPPSLPSYPPSNPSPR